MKGDLAAICEYQDPSNTMDRIADLWWKRRNWYYDDFVGFLADCVRSREIVVKVGGEVSVLMNDGAQRSRELWCVRGMGVVVYASIVRWDSKDILIRASRSKKVIADTGKKSSMETFAPNDKADYYSGITSITVNGKNAYELKVKFLDDLHNNAFSGTNGKDASDKEETAEIFKIETDVFDYKTPLCLAFNEFNYLLKVDPDLLTKDIMGFKTYEDYKNDWIYEWNENVPWVYDKPWLDNGIWKEPKLHTILENRSITKTLNAMIVGKDGRAMRFTTTIIIKEEYENESHEEGHKLCGIKTREAQVCQIKRYKMIKYSFNDEEEYVAVKEDEYNDLTITSEEACRAYQEIFRMMDGG
ncbi:hypothetical protein Tco_0122018 [Tanacetum coccineum]